MAKSFMRTCSILTILFCISASISLAQNSELFKLWPDSVLTKANTAKDVSYMSAEEKEVIYYMNLVRLNPPLFANTFLDHYIDTSDQKRDKYIKELIKYLKERQDMELLYPERDLYETAKNHASDMGASGRTGHNSSDGSSFSVRMETVRESYHGINENCNYGLSNGLDIVMDLLIDREVSNAGHRKNILDSEMRFVGVSIEPHKRFKHNCVQDFGGKKRKPEE